MGDRGSLDNTEKVTGLNTLRSDVSDIGVNVIMGNRYLRYSGSVIPKSRLAMGAAQIDDGSMGRF